MIWYLASGRTQHLGNIWETIISLQTQRTTEHILARIRKIGEQPLSEFQKHGVFLSRDGNFDGSYVIFVCGFQKNILKFTKDTSTQHLATLTTFNTIQCSPFLILFVCSICCIDVPSPEPFKSVYIQRVCTMYVHAIYSA